MNNAYSTFSVLALPYCMILAKIFQYFTVPLSGEVFVGQRRTKTIDVSTPGRMKF